jgi:transposase-like protein
MGFRAEHPAKAHNTNPRERLNGEIKRRSEVVGVFPDEGARPAWSVPSCSSKMMNVRSNAPQT